MVNKIPKACANQIGFVSIHIVLELTSPHYHGLLGMSALTDSSKELGFVLSSCQVTASASVSLALCKCCLDQGLVTMVAINNLHLFFLCLCSYCKNKEIMLIIFLHSIFVVICHFL